MSRTAGRHTKVGIELFDWAPFKALSIVARYVWIAIYSGPDGKNSLPGLLRASVRSLAEMASIDADECMSAMDELATKGMVEHDIERRIIRLTMLPDKQERPYNPNQVKGWWSRFQAFPDCEIRNAHVKVIRWLCEVSPGVGGHLAEAFNETFQSIPETVVVAKKARRQRFNSDTSTASQPSLFASGPDVARADVKRSADDGLIEKSGTSETVTKPPGTGIGSVPSSSSPDLVAPPHPERAAVEISTTRPTLGLVPPPPDLPFTPRDLVDEMAKESGGRFTATAIDHRLLDALCATIRGCAANGLGLPDVRTAGRWLAAGGLSYRNDLTPRWLAAPGALLEAIALSAVWAKTGGPVGGPHSTEPAPASAFGSGRRQL